MTASPRSLERSPNIEVPEPGLAESRDRASPFPGGQRAPFAHALTVLDFAAVLELVGGFTASEAGRRRVRSLAPRTEREWIERERDRVAVLRAVFAGPRPWTAEHLPEIGARLEMVAVPGTWLEPEELRDLLGLLAASRTARNTLSHPDQPDASRALLAPLVNRLVLARPIEDAISSAVDAEGRVVDGASRELKRIRAELRDSESRLVKLLERIMASLDSHHRVADMSVTIRNGRYVIPVRRDARAVVGGIVHDSSATEATLFVEPPEAVEFGNRVRELEAEEAREIIRVLTAITDLIRPDAGAIIDALDSLVELDSLAARAVYADRYDCNPTDVAADSRGIAVVDGRHPLLLARGGDVVPFDLFLAADERTLLLSGPNTGGKTVLLKALGLFAVMVQSGVHAPVGSGSRMPVFDDVFADIGDEQSIAASLSTFSAHVSNLREIVVHASSRSLVLVDELGSGTDPSEGGALGAAILEHLTDRGALTIATTHLGSLKLLATERGGIVNASLQFDPERLEPTYELVKGRPGRSYGLEIARRFRIPADILKRASRRLSSGERDLAALLESLERRESGVRDAERELATMLEEARVRGALLSEGEAKVRARERAAEREGRSGARKYLLEARAAVEETIRELKRVGKRDVDSAARDARRRIEELAAAESSALAPLDAEEPAARAENIAVGDWVESSSIPGRPGRVLEVRDDEVVIGAGALKLAVARASVTRAKPRPAPLEPVPLRGDLHEMDADREIDVRGLRPDELEPVVTHAVDSAVRADLPTLRIIHGKGTGALRDRVSEMLRREPRVARFRLGDWGEGGTGVTVVEFGE